MVYLGSGPIVNSSLLKKQLFSSD